jgi:hypothetical protein
MGTKLPVKVSWWHLFRQENTHSGHEDFLDFADFSGLAWVATTVVKIEYRHRC